MCHLVKKVILKRYNCFVNDIFKGDKDMVDLCDLQKQILQNKKDKGFNTTNIAEELADVAIFLLRISEILDINLEKETINKMQKNKNLILK